MSAWNLRPYILVSLAQESILHRNLDKNPATKTLTYNLPCLHDVLEQWWSRTCGSG